MNQTYRFRRAESAADAEKLKRLFNAVFHPEEVGTLAETFFHHLPGMRPEFWFIAEEISTGEIVSGFALIPWTLQMEEINLKVAEMGIVGTLEAHRGQGLFRRLNQDFERTLLEEGFDLAMIQGIPGFYGQFGYHYALPLENHINLPLERLPDLPDGEEAAFRLAGLEDIPFLLREDQAFLEAYSLAAVRDAEHWAYLLTESRKTEYGSEFWILTHSAGQYYFRIPEQGFGTGLIVSEVSEGIPEAAFQALSSFCKRCALEREKPYIRFNLHNESAPGKFAIAAGAEPGSPYAWQIKIPDAARFLRSISPLLERRLQASGFHAFSDTFRLNFFREAVDLVWQGGRLAQVRPAQGDCQHSFSIGAAQFPALCLGHRSWQELRRIHPDIYPGSDLSEAIIDALFPPTRSWIHEQY